MQWKCFSQYANKFGKLSSGHRAGKCQFSLQSQRKAISKNVQTTTQLHSSSHTSKVMLKILQARLQQLHVPWTSRCSSWFKKRQRNQTSNCQYPLDYWKSESIPEKYLLLLYWLGQSLSLCGSQQTVENSSRVGNTRPRDLPPEKSVCRSQSKELRIWNNRLVPNQERIMSRLYIVTLLI